jgi:flagellar basal-body rod modification protein FlgD
MATPNVTSSSLLQNVSRYEDVKDAAKKTSEDMGKQDFLTLFTAQLQNQNPLEPVKNEAFVAQLAQFSQLEALTNMQGSMDNLVKTMAGERMLNGASLIGLKVAVSDSLSRLEAGGSIEGKVDLPFGASGINVRVFNQQGALVKELAAGPQTPGAATLEWDGTDAIGNPAPAGLYRITANAVVNGKNTDVSVDTLSTVRSVSTNPTDGSVSLELEGGKSVLMSSVKRVGF